MNLASDLPSFETTQAALRLTTEHLARELYARSDIAPRWSDFEWTAASAVCALQGISTLLANRTRWRGPAFWQEFLVEQRCHSVARDAQVGTLLATLDDATRKAGIATVALKGSALRPLGMYAAGERPQGDVDLLVDPRDLARMAPVLESLGYVESLSVRRHVAYEPRHREAGAPIGEHRGNPLKIEVHTHIAEPLPATHIDITARLLPHPMAPGINAYRDPLALLLHLALHAAGNMRAHALRLVQLRDLALLAPRLEPRDWNELVSLPRSLGGSWWLLAPLAMVERYHPGAIPGGVLDELARTAPRPLRWKLARQQLTDLSWSNLRIDALPGIEWSRTPLEALRFARSRIAPTRVAREELAASVTSLRTLSQSGWYELAHWRRMLRWLFGQPARVQTLNSLHAALAASACLRKDPGDASRSSA